MAKTDHPLEVSGCGGGLRSGSLAATDFKLSFPKDHTKGEEPITIVDYSTSLSKFPQALAQVKNEKQVIILIDNSLARKACEAIFAHLPKDSSRQHHFYKRDNKGIHLYLSLTL